MLTKDLLRYKIQSGQIYPQFVDPNDNKLLAISAQLISVFEESPDKKRSTLLEASKHVIDSTSGTLVVKRGLEKLLLDRTKFDTTPNEGLIAFRQKLFTETSQLLSQEQFQNYADYQRKVLQIVENESSLPEDGELGDRLYADLPSGQRVLSFRTLSPEHGLHRYNTAQVQGLLLHCNSLTLKLTDSMTAELRQLFKYLRFNQLLSTIRKEKTENEDLFQITVDGPLNLFFKTKRYGMNLAKFFVAVLHQSKWELTAEIQFRNKRSSRLCLDESCGIKPISQQFLAYIPEDIQLFQEMLRNKTDDWQIRPGSQFLPLAGDFYCFPDYQLIHTSGVEVAIELFHPWHQVHLLARLNTLAEQTGTPLILGVSKELEKKPIIADALEASAYFSRCGFTFRDIPTMGALLPILNLLQSVS
jgi:predicted nuclease of restriction endonuclease-like RecB superfamily